MCVDIHWGRGGCNCAVDLWAETGSWEGGGREGKGGAERFVCMVCKVDLGAGLSHVVRRRGFNGEVQP